MEIVALIAKFGRKKAIFQTFCHLLLWRKYEEYFSRYKFMGDYCLRKIFQQEIKANLKPFLKKGYILVPVPLSEERLEDRGFNQVKDY